jgi:hypothetical protein
MSGVGSATGVIYSHFLKSADRAAADRWRVWSPGEGARSRLRERNRSRRAAEIFHVKY